MKRVLLLGAIIGAAVAGLVNAPAAEAGDRKSVSREVGLNEHPKSAYYRRRGLRPQVRGYVVRRGGYSYSYFDSLNTYGNPRTLYGGTNLYRDPMLDRQTNAGPFDHGFFFDSAIMPHGGEAPYLH